MSKKKLPSLTIKGIERKIDVHNRTVDFRDIIKVISGYDVEAINTNDPQDKKLVDDIKKAMQNCMRQVRTDGGINKSRPNEVGNAIEKYVRCAINQSNTGLCATNPTGRGYPDVLITEISSNRPTYLEVKTYSEENENSTNRSFYLSPSDAPKVTQNARHLLVGFEMLPPSGQLYYVPSKFKLVDLSKLVCKIKFEIQSNNQDIYDQKLIL